MAFTLPDLPYPYDALEPHLDERTMRIHHGKHHRGYTNTLNGALRGTKWEHRPIAEILRSLDRIPEAIRTTVRNNGGGFANHRLFWQVMSPHGGGAPSGDLRIAIEDAFGSFERFKEEFASTAAGQFGSGWGWLVTDPSGTLQVYATPNQDSPYLNGDVPLLGVDVWEHAYYLHYQNLRDEYLDAWWNVVNWDRVEDNFQRAQGEKEEMAAPAG